MFYFNKRLDIFPISLCFFYFNKFLYHFEVKEYIKSKYVYIKEKLIYSIIFFKSNNIHTKIIS